MPLGAANLNGLARYVAPAGSTRTPRTITIYGDAQIDTAQSKFGGSSVLFDGTGDQLQIDMSDIFETSSDFTVEGWYRFNSLPASGVADLFMFGIVNVGSRVDCYVNSSGQVGVDFRGGIPDIAAGGSVSTGNWYHVALVQSSGSCTLYLNGSSVNSCTPGVAVGGNGIMQISGYRLNSTVSRSIDGWMDEFRVSSVARYTGSFTPSTGAFTNDDDTQLLIHGDGSDGSTSITDDGG